jgi:hypothetical protein
MTTSSPKSKARSGSGSRLRSSAALHGVSAVKCLTIRSLVWRAEELSVVGHVVGTFGSRRSCLVWRSRTIRNPSRSLIIFKLISESISLVTLAGTQSRTEESLPAITIASQGHGGFHTVVSFSRRAA